MTYKRFEDLPVWQAARRLFTDICRLTSQRGFPRRADLRDQLERAALSVGNNIAEGFERGTTPELLTFLYIARGSVGEVRSALLFAKALHDDGVEPGPPPVLEAILALTQQAESVSRQIRAWAESLQNSDIPGQRHLTDQTKQAYVSGKKAEAFRQRLAESQRRATENWLHQSQEP